MNLLITKGIMSGLLLISTPLFSQVATSQSLNEKIVKMKNQNDTLKEYILLVYLPLSYGPEEAKEVREQWNKLLAEWKTDGTYITSFVYPNDGYVVAGPEKSITTEGMASGNYKLVSNMVLRAADYERALELAKKCPVFQQNGHIQVREIQPRPATQESNLDLAKNKALVRHLYEDVLNTGMLAQLKEIISDQYIGPSGETGADGFAETVNSIRTGFPDIKWTVEDLVAEGNKVTVKWSWKGTNKGSFRGFPVSNSKVTNNAIAIYELSESKIIRAWIQSDRLSFLQQIGIIRPDITAPVR